MEGFSVALVFHSITVRGQVMQSKFQVGMKSTVIVRVYV